MYLVKHQFFGHLHENFGQTKSWNWFFFPISHQMYSMFDFKQDFFFFLLKFWNYFFFVLKISHVWCPQRITLISLKYFLGKISLLSHHGRKKKEIPPLFPNPTQEITPYPSQYHLTIWPIALLAGNGFHKCKSKHRSSFVYDTIHATSSSWSSGSALKWQVQTKSWEMMKPSNMEPLCNFSACRKFD
jgi:hypothetical protein